MSNSKTKTVVIFVLLIILPFFKIFLLLPVEVIGTEDMIRITLQYKISQIDR